LATYIMAANRKALEYLPEGVDINAITCEELAAWAAAVEAATGERRLGLPAGRAASCTASSRGTSIPPSPEGSCAPASARPAATDAHRPWRRVKGRGETKIDR
jgi:multiple sugar transport system substrate-binding protein